MSSALPIRLFALTSRPVYVGWESASGRQVARRARPCRAAARRSCRRRSAVPCRRRSTTSEVTAAPSDGDPGGRPDQPDDGAAQVVADLVDDAGQPHRVAGQCLGALLVDALQLDVQPQRPVVDVDGERAERGTATSRRRRAGRNASVASNGPIGAEIRPNSSDGDQAPARATRTRTPTGRRSARARRQGDGGDGRVGHPARLRAGVGGPATEAATARTDRRRRGPPPAGRSSAAR